MTAIIRHASNHASERIISSRGFALWLIPLLLLIFISGRASAQFAGGTGTAQNPYLVPNLTQLQAIRNASNTAHFRLINNIDANGQGFNPIGSFGGVLDGDGFTISNLVITSTGNQVALFTQLVNNAMVKNLTLQNITVNGRNQTGSVAGTFSGGVIQNVSVLGSISGTGYVGGLVGEVLQGSVISQCYSTATVNNSGQYTGGLAGSVTQGLIENNKHR